MEKVVVSLGRKSYPIYINWDLFYLLGEEISSCEKVAVITNPEVKMLYGEKVKEAFKKTDIEVIFFEVPEGEEQKSLKSANRLYSQLAKNNFLRYHPIITLGGGVIGDLGGFVASTYMRGVPFIQVPTTLLAQVDSSVGGKVAVNHPRGKNLIGTFYQPKFVLISLLTLKSLPYFYFKTGIAEVIKYGFLAGEDFLSFLEKNLEKVIKCDREVILKVVKECCEIKARITEEDELDLSGKRAILNYGHTIGHALETISEYKELQHGEAISLGMVVESWISHKLGYISKDVVERQISLLSRVGLPTSLPSLSVDKVLSQITLDKKAKVDKPIFALLKGVGNPSIQEVPQKIIIESLKEIIKV